MPRNARFCQTMPRQNPDYAKRSHGRFGAAQTSYAASVNRHQRALRRTLLRRNSPLPADRPQDALPLAEQRPLHRRGLSTLCRADHPACPADIGGRDDRALSRDHWIMPKRPSKGGSPDAQIARLTEIKANPSIPEALEELT